MRTRSTVALFALLAAFAIQAEKSERALALGASDASLEWGPCPAFMPKGCQLAVLHGDPTQPNADVFLKVPPKSEIAAHWHTSAERMILVAGEMQVTYDGEPTVTLKPGMYAYGPARLTHEATCNSTEACVLFIAFESPVDAVATESKAK